MKYLSISTHLYCKAYNKQKESICCVIKAAVCYFWAGQHLSGSLSAFLKCNTALKHQLYSLN